MIKASCKPTFPKISSSEATPLASTPPTLLCNEQLIFREGTTEHSTNVLNKTELWSVKPDNTYRKKGYICWGVERRGRRVGEERIQGTAEMRNDPADFC